MRDLSINAIQTMSTKEIATVTGKHHSHVMRDTRTMLSKLYDVDPNMDDVDIKGFFVGGREDNGKVSEYHLDRYHTEVLITGYDVKRRAAVIVRWFALETGAAQPVAAPAPVTPMQKAVSDMHEWKSAAALFGIPDAVAMVEGVKHVEHLYAVDFKPLLLSSPMMDDIKDDEVMLEPTEIGKRIGYSGKEVNLALLKAGLQTKVDGQWQPTEKAQGYTSRHFWMSKQSGKSGYNYKWNLEFVRRQLGK